MSKYRKKPVVIKAMRWMTDNYDAIDRFCNIPESGCEMWPHENGSDLVINTLEGEMTCKPFDWIIKGIKGEFYPCKDDVFQKSYDKVEE